jgi:2-dehydro-3-deoxyphosphogalactonate aldolase
MPTLDHVLTHGAPPALAILRGVKPSDAAAIGSALVEAGVRIIEVPLNSPDAFASIATLQEEFGKDALIGAGTVLDAASVDRLAETGARLLVAPNTDARVIARGVALGLEVMPGFLTPSEALAAIEAGARRLKLFPAFSAGPTFLKAVREVLPADIAIWAVGGVDAANAADWLAAGAEGVALGGALYRPGMEPAEVGRRARALVAALDSRETIQ